MKEAVKLAEYVRELGFTPEQVQDFYPTPSTLSTCMYYTGIHPLTGEKVYVPKNAHEKSIQRALMQYKNPANRELVLEGFENCRTHGPGWIWGEMPDLDRSGKVMAETDILKIPDAVKLQDIVQGIVSLSPRKKTIRNNHTRKKQK